MCKPMRGHCSQRRHSRQKDTNALAIATQLLGTMLTDSLRAKAPTSNPRELQTGIIDSPVIEPSISKNLEPPTAKKKCDKDCDNCTLDCKKRR